MKAIFVLSTCCLIVTGCNTDHEPRSTDRHTTVENGNQRVKLVTPDDQNRLGTRSDNRNGLETRVTPENRLGTRSDNRNGLETRDQRNVLKTPENQSESEGDRRITQRARQAVVDRDDLSTNAKNIKIITVERVVQLRGAVDNDREHATVVELIKVVPGVQRVDDRLEVQNKGE